MGLVQVPPRGILQKHDFRFSGRVGGGLHPGYVAGPVRFGDDRVRAGVGAEREQVGWPARRREQHREGHTEQSSRHRRECPRHGSRLGVSCETCRPLLLVATRRRWRTLKWGRVYQRYCGCRASAKLSKQGKSAAEAKAVNQAGEKAVNQAGEAHPRCARRVPQALGLSPNGRGSRHRRVSAAPAGSLRPPAPQSAYREFRARPL